MSNYFLNWMYKIKSIHYHKAEAPTEERVLKLKGLTPWYIAIMLHRALNEKYSRSSWKYEDGEFWADVLFTDSVLMIELTNTSENAVVEGTTGEFFNQQFNHHREVVVISDEDNDYWLNEQQISAVIHYFNAIK